MVDLCAVLLPAGLQDAFLGMYVCPLERAQRESGPAPFSVGVKQRSLGGQEGRAGQMEGAEHPSRSDLCCHSSIFRLFANTSYNEY